MRTPSWCSPSDHGDYLSSHGNQHQKWYSAYQEIVNVPCVISNPKMFPRPKVVDAATNHVDLIPTMLGLAGIDPEPIRRELSKSFTEAQPLVGRNLANLVTGKIPSDAVKDPVYFMTDDDISRGSNQFNWVGYPFNAVVQPNHIETALVWLDGAYWKFSRYFDAPQFWSAPGYPAEGCGKDSVVGEVTANKPPGRYTVPVSQTVKDQPVPAQFEMYNVTADPWSSPTSTGSRAMRGSRGSSWRYSWPRAVPRGCSRRTHLHPGRNTAEVAGLVPCRDGAIRDHGRADDRSRHSAPGMTLPRRQPGREGESM